MVDNEKEFSPLTIKTVDLKGFYFRSNIWDILLSEKLPASRATYIKYLDRGVFSEPDRFVFFKKKKYRLFTGAEVLEIVEKVREFKKNESGTKS